MSSGVKVEMQVDNITIKNFCYNEKENFYG